MKFYFEGVVISTQSRESKDKKMYHRINVDQDGEIVTLDCAEEVLGTVEKYKPYHLEGLYSRGEYDGRVFSRLSVVKAVLVK